MWNAGTPNVRDYVKFIKDQQMHFLFFVCFYYTVTTNLFWVPKEYGAYQTYVTTFDDLRVEHGTLITHSPYALRAREFYLGTPWRHRGKADGKRGLTPRILDLCNTKRGQLHTLTALLLRKRPPVPYE